jgi:flagellin
MTSILTNASAMTALRNLTMTQQALSTTQEQLSTGLNVGNAKDNTAYWSIAQTMTSDNGALGAVSATLKQSGSMLSNFASALNQSISVVNNIKNDLVSALNTADTDKLAKIQTDIAGQQASLMQIVSGAAFNGQNWLNGTVNGATASSVTSTEKLVGAYTNTGGVSYISVMTSDVNLVKDTNSTTAATGGILGTTQSNTSATFTGGYSVIGTANNVALASTTAQSTIQNMLTSVNATISKLETAAATVGAAQAQITTQQTFIASMQTNLSNGVSALVDADMNQVSTRLQALQTQQQLGVQSLSIANQSSQMILKLFQ